MNKEEIEEKLKKQDEDFRKVNIGVTISKFILDAFDYDIKLMGRNRSEMIEALMNEYLCRDEEK